MFENELAKTTSGCGIGNIKKATITQKLTSRKERLEAELSEVNGALDVLIKNPEIQTIIDSISRVNLY